MILTAFLAIGLAPIHFKGGSPTDFIGEIADVTKATTMVVYSREYHLSPLKIDIGDTSKAYDEINGKTPFLVLGGGEYLMHDKYYPEEWFQRLSNSYKRSPSTNASRLDKLTSEGTVTWDSRKQGSITIEDLKKAKWKKPLHVFWLFRPMALAVITTKTPEKQFLIDLAKDLGGSFADNGDSYSINANWGSAYSRVDKTVSEMVSQSDKEASERQNQDRRNRGRQNQDRMQLDRDLWLGIFHDIGESLVSNFLDSPNDQKTIEVASKSRYASTVHNFLVKLRNTSAGGRQANELNQMDSRYPTRVMIRQDGEIQVEVPIGSGRRGQVRYVRI